MSPKRPSIVDIRVRLVVIVPKIFPDTSTRNWAWWVGASGFEAGLLSCQAEGSEDLSLNPKP